VNPAAELGWDHLFFGRFDKSIESFDKAILASPYDPFVHFWYGGKACANFGLKRYDQAIELARQAIVMNPNYVQYIHACPVAALALTGHDAEAREALQRYLALPSTGPLKTIAAWKAYYYVIDDLSGRSGATAVTPCWRGSVLTLPCPTSSWRWPHASGRGTSRSPAARGSRTWRRGPKCPI
jgi:tetratricopeptide (TPR) repeat protein